MRVVLGMLAGGALVAACGAPSPGSTPTRPTTAPATTTVPAAASMPTPGEPGTWDWPSYGHDPQHTFAGRTTLTARSVRTLRAAWFLPTGDAVSATPTVVDGTVYVGSWDDYFYAVDLRTGTLRWKMRLASQNGITPYPGEKPRNSNSDGGLVTSSAWYEPPSGGRPALVIFGAGYTLYALEAATGATYWQHAYSGRPDQPLDPDTDPTRIFSSPVVADGEVLFGVDVDGARGYGGYVVAASLDTGKPVWEVQTDAGQDGDDAEDGCGSVWSSGTILPAADLVVFGSADCNFNGTQQWAESVFAMDIDDGHLVWKLHPGDPTKCDSDFGASPNAGVDAKGDATFLGEGSKGGTYYSIDPATGAVRWSTNVVFGGFAGGFIGTTAYDGTSVYGSTALGDFGNFLPNGKAKLCDPSNPRDTPTQDPSAHSFDAATGAVRWQANRSASFGATTFAGGMVFNGPALSVNAVNVRSAATGALLAQIKLPLPTWSGITTVGDALVLGIGTSYNATHAGIEVLTPGGTPPVVPSG
jgi:polyvinyl alcohol dehydrogenase (cytochrome)